MEVLELIWALLLLEKNVLVISGIIFVGFVVLSLVLECYVFSIADTKKRLGSSLFFCQSDARFTSKMKKVISFVFLNWVVTLVVVGMASWLAFLISLLVLLH